MNKVVRLALLLLAVPLVQCCAGFFVDMTTTPPVPAATDENVCARWEKRTPGITAWVDSVRKNSILKDTVMDVNGARLRAFYASAEQPSSKTAVIIHGFLVNPMAVMMLARMYRDSLGYNVWVPEQRHHGESGGNAVQFGWKERFDALEWSRIAHECFGDDLQVMHGMSMGAATVMMASGEELPEYLKGFVEDCGYTSVWEEFSYARKKYLRWDDEKSLYRSEQINKQRYGWDYHEASCLDQVAKCSKPMLFIHGGADPLVPTEMGWSCYRAKKTGYRELWIAPGSAHSKSFPDHPQEYVSRVRNFLHDHVETL